MESTYTSTDTNTPYENETNSQYHESSHAQQSSDEFLQRIEILDPSGLVTFLIGFLESIETRFQKSKQMIDIITFERIATEILQRYVDIFNRNAENFQFRLELERINDSNRNN